MSPDSFNSTPKSANPWFTSTVGLLCLMAGYGLGSFTGGANIIAMQPSVPSVPDTIAQAPSVPETTAEPATTDDDPMIGDEDAAVTIVEFTDYQCPFCARHFTQTHGQIMSQYVDTGKVKLVVRDYPLSFHPHAQKAAEATECADEQGKFWEMHDKLFETQDSWSNATDSVATFKQFATDLGLNAASFNTCLDSGAQAQEVAADLAAGSAAGISGTPGFWVIGPDGQSKLISGAYPFSEFQTTIDSMLQ